MLVKTKSDLVKTNVVERAMALGDEHGYYFRTMPNIGVISEPVMINGWRFVPLEQDSTPIPNKVQEAIMLLKDEEFPIKQLIIVHEPKRERKQIDIPSPNWSTVMTALRGIGLVLWAVGTVVFYAIIAALSLLDPACIVIFEGEERWMLCIATWDEHGVF